LHCSRAGRDSFCHAPIAPNIRRILLIKAAKL
jgi:hypothetical protein